MSEATPKDINEYISMFPKDIQKVLEEIRITIKKAVPEAVEAISYQIPTFKLNGNLVHFGAFKNHIGFYPTPKGIEAFKKELSVYEGAKGSVRFPLDQPMPLELISKIVKQRVKESLEKAGTKKTIKSVKETSDIFPGLSAPARRALANSNITTLEQLAKYSKADILKLHGIGKTALPKLITVLETKGLTFKNNETN